MSEPFSIDYITDSGVFCKVCGAQLALMYTNFGNGDNVTEYTAVCECVSNRREYERKLSQNVEG